MPVWLAGSSRRCRAFVSSPGAAWIIWQILSAQGRADQPFASGRPAGQPTGLEDRHQRNRDSWAMGSPVAGPSASGWGAPMATPCPAHGQSAAVPLLLSVYSRLSDNSPCRHNLHLR